MEAMLRSFGLGEVMDAANQLAQSGAVPKVVAFAESVGPLAVAIFRAEAKLDALAAQAGSSAPDGGPWDAYDWDAAARDAWRKSVAGSVASGRGDAGGHSNGPIIEGRAIGGTQ
ncbi:MAG: hypothetical protein IPK79_01335 [Vampirovibrionales bacterium]|nr:hypothetical protein [Vampirovibrionales bacterium]